MKKTRYSMVVAIFLALILSALNVTPVFADESAPPEVAPTEEVNETVEESEPVVTEEEPEEGTESESPSVAEIIESLPEDTDLIVLDENGEALPLASEEAAEVIKVADPQWCPVGVTPGSPSCSGEKASFNGADPNTSLIAWLEANLASIGKAGVIWIAWDYEGTLALESGPIVLNGDNLGNMGNYALTINGGWTSGKTLNPNTPSTFNVPLNIINWTGAITINNIVVDGASGMGETALWIETKGNIVLNNVDVQNNTTEWAAYLENDGDGKGTVTVNDSAFNNNTGVNARGLEIYSNNTVTIKNITAMSNANGGVFINNAGASTPKPVVLNGTNHFSYNTSSDGLMIYSQGAITLSNVTAVGNTEGYGVLLDNCDFDTSTFYCLQQAAASGVTIKGVNNFSDNGYDGLRVWSGGAITVSNLTANNNGTSATRPGATGPYPDNFDATGKGAFLFNFGASTSKNIVISGTNTFNGNASTGLHADSYGKVTVSNLTASFNGCDMTFELGDDYCAGAYIYAEGGVTQTGYGRFEGNGLPDGAPGLLIYSFNKGAVVLSNLYADSNVGGGVEVIAGGFKPINVTLNGINTFTNNDGDGLYIETDGAVTLNNITANYNTFAGAYIMNDYALTPKAVIIKGMATFNQNDEDGLIVLSYGAVTTSGLTAISNGNIGVVVDNCMFDFVSGCYSDAAPPVNLNGNNFIEGNNSIGGIIPAGLLVFSRGSITVSNLTANYNLNDAAGALLMNQFDNAPAGITLKGFVTTSFNDGSGIGIFSHGAVTIANLTANDNGLSNTAGEGVYIDNATNPYKPMNVTITGTNQVNSNFEDGMIIYTYGAVQISNLTANYNGSSSIHYGLDIDNGDGYFARPVTLLGTNTFNDNFGSGLNIYSLGAITVSNVMASYNGQNGASLDNNNDPSISQPVTIKGYGIFNDNGGAHTGLFIESNGNVTIANITANNNGDYGAYIQAERNTNVANTTFANVTITGMNTFNNNGINGLVIENDGLITISNITANNNEEEGVVLDNVSRANPNSTGIKNITINGVNMFNGNKGTGLLISASGTVTLTRITANFNNNLGSGSGLEVTTINGAINLTCGSMYSNAQYGYNLTAGGGKAITIKGVFTLNNPLGVFSTNPTILTRACPLP